VTSSVRPTLGEKIELKKNTFHGTDTPRYYYFQKLDTIEEGKIKLPSGGEDTDTGPEKYPVLISIHG
jgi:hypothetical protein